MCLPKWEAGGPDFYLPELIYRDNSDSKAEFMSEANGNGFRKGALRPWEYALELMETSLQYEHPASSDSVSKEEH